MVEVPPFICECSDPSCTAVVRLTLAEYEHVRGDGRRFFNLPGHEHASGPWGRVVERHDRYLVVEKVGDAADVARQEAPPTLEETG